METDNKIIETKAEYLTIIREYMKFKGAKCFKGKFFFDLDTVALIIDSQKSSYSALYYHNYGFIIKTKEEMSNFDYNEYKGDIVEIIDMITCERMSPVDVNKALIAEIGKTTKEEFLEQLDYSFNKQIVPFFNNPLKYIIDNINTFLLSEDHRNKIKEAYERNK